MTTSKREQILAALMAVIATVEPGATRNAPLALVEDGEVVSLRDGEIDLTDEFFNGADTIHEFTASPSLILLIRETTPADDDALEGIDAQLDARITTLAAAIKAAAADPDGDLVQLVTAVRVQPADYEPKDIFGAEDFKGAEVTIEIDYWSASSAG